MLTIFVFKWPLVMLSGRESTESDKRRKTKRNTWKKKQSEKKDSYIPWPSSQLSREALSNRREELRQKSKRFYWRHKQTKNWQSDDEAEEQSTSQLKVKLPILKKDRFKKNHTEGP